MWVCGERGVGQMSSVRSPAAIAPERRTILGVSTEALTSESAADWLDARMTRRQTTKVAFLNAHMATMARRDTFFRKVLDDFTVFNDGVGVDIASLFKYGKSYPDNLNGTDFIPFFLARTKNRLRIYLLGARPDVVEKTAERLAADFPQHRIVGACDGYSYRYKNVAGLIHEAQADLILVALGNPLQEVWIADNLAASGAVMAMGVGSFFNFTANAVPRAPRLVRKLRGEWLFRLWLEPRRLWRRYVDGGVVFLAHAVRDAIVSRLKAGA